MTSIKPYKIISILSLCVFLSDAFAELTDAQQSQLNNLLIHDCGSCHGLKRNGGLGPALHANQMQKYSVDALIAVILEGIPGTAMPPWRGLLSEDEARYLAQELLMPTLIRP